MASVVSVIVITEVLTPTYPKLPFLSVVKFRVIPVEFDMKPSLRKVTAYSYPSIVIYSLGSS